MIEPTFTAHPTEARRKTVKSKLREIPKLFEFRSWAGSDRDGNPYVTPGVTANTLEASTKK